MAVTITDNRTVVDQADTITDWTASRGVAVFTSAPNPVEAAACLGQQVSNTTEEAYHTFAAANLTDTLIYVWLLPGGVLDTTANGGVQVIVGDGTDRAGWHVGGSDGAGFRHDDGPVVWQNFVIDTGSLPANTTTFAGGGAASVTFTSITQIGAAFKTLAKSVGGVENCFYDIIRYGNNGLTITGGGVGTEGKFLEIAIEDRSEANLTAYGICRELGTDLFGLKGPLTWGDTGTGSVNFQDRGVTVVFEDVGIGTNKYGLTIVGGTGTTSVVFGDRDDVGSGSNGVNFLCPAGVGAFFTASDTDINTLGLYGCSFTGFDQGVTFTTNATTGPNHEVFSTIFNGCSQITIGQVEFRSNSIQATTSTGVTEAAVLIEDTTNVSDLSFTSGGTGHAIEISDSTNSPFTFDNFTYAGYATVDGGTGNEGVVNTSGNPITINITGGDVPTVDTTNSTGTVTIINNVTVSITVQDSTSNPIQNAVVGVYNSNTDAEIANDETDTNGAVTFSTLASTPLYIRVLKSTIGNTRYIPVETVANTGATGLELTVTLVQDEIANT